MAPARRDSCATTVRRLSARSVEPPGRCACAFFGVPTESGSARTCTALPKQRLWSTPTSGRATTAWSATGRRSATAPESGHATTMATDPRGSCQHGRRYVVNGAKFSVPLPRSSQEALGWLCGHLWVQGQLEARHAGLHRGAGPLTLFLNMSHNFES